MHNTPDLETAIKEFLDFGHPREGSFRYHAAWENLKSAFDHFKKEGLHITPSEAKILDKASYDEHVRKYSKYK